MCGQYFHISIRLDNLDLKICIMWVEYLFLQSELILSLTPFIKCKTSLKSFRRLRAQGRKISDRFIHIFTQYSSFNLAFGSHANTNTTSVQFQMQMQKAKCKCKCKRQNMYKCKCYKILGRSIHIHIHRTHPQFMIFSNTHTNTNAWLPYLSHVHNAQPRFDKSEVPFENTTVILYKC